MGKFNPQKGGNKRNKDNGENSSSKEVETEGEISLNEEELDYEDNECARSPVRKLAKTVLKEIVEEKNEEKATGKNDETNDKQDGKSTSPSGEEKDGKDGEGLQLRSRKISKDRASVSKKLEFSEVSAQESSQVTQDLANSELTAEEIQALPVETVTTPVKEGGSKPITTPSRSTKVSGQGMKTPGKLTQTKGKITTAGTQLKQDLKKQVRGLRRVKNVVYSDSGSSSSSSSESGSSQSSSEDERTYRRSRSKRKKRGKKRRRRSRSSSGSSDKRDEVRRRKKRRSRSKSKRKEGMKAILQELADLKKQLNSDKQGTSNKIDDTDTGSTGPVTNGIKSPSDTGLYAPAVMKEKHFASPKLNVTNKIINQGKEPARDDPSSLILEFIKNIRLTDKPTGRVRSEVVKPGVASTSGETEEDRQRRSSQERAENEVLEAEKFNATINPPGMSYYDVIKQLKLKDPDEDYYHIVCHVEEILKNKIKKGGFVELEKLLKKGRLGKTKERWQMGRDADGTPMWEPMEDRETRINNVYKWDQAFRVYATIYSQEHPSRASEIWQYIESIHNAAKIYSWDNVANYDYCFRQLMSDNPDRSWAKPYLQMWTTTLCEPHGRGNNRQDNQNRRDGRNNNICWKFNRNKCHNPHCRFEHRCAYCYGLNHSSMDCFKKKWQAELKERQREVWVEVTWEKAFQEALNN